ncbi:metal-dependent hydrolase [Chloroflexota bacterium]
MPDDVVTIAYFGASAFRITTSRDKKILIDPYLAQNPMCQKPLDYFYDTDLILVSHGSWDHFGDTVDIMKGSKAVLICGAEVSKYCQEVGVPAERIKATLYGDHKEFDGIHTKAVYARHVSRIQGETETYYGQPMGFVITTEDDIRIYHTGDTSLFGDLKLIGRLYQPHILMTEIAGVGEGYNSGMSVNEAAMAALYVGPDAVMPMHYPPGSDAPLRFSEALKVIAPNVKPVIIEPNSQITYSKYQIRVG